MTSLRCVHTPTARQPCLLPHPPLPPLPGAAAPINKDQLEGCLGSCVAALGVVMAGSGHLPTLKLLRGACRGQAAQRHVPLQLGGG